mmetsp:Transcript_5775/g.17025  ORF Transcript_5775/g.17025 Transcript_5775/m.17025 type:complete len:170 (+) Transcript_5775:104-613(+)
MVATTKMNNANNRGAFAPFASLMQQNDEAKRSLSKVSSAWQKVGLRVADVFRAEQEEEDRIVSKLMDPKLSLSKVALRSPAECTTAPGTPAANDILLCDSSDDEDSSAQGSAQDSLDSKDALDECVGDDELEPEGEDRLVRQEARWRDVSLRMAAIFQDAANDADSLTF